MYERPSRSCCRVLVSSAWTSAAAGTRSERGRVQWAQLAGATMEKPAHRAPGDRDADVPVEFLETVLRRGLAAFADDEMSNEARRIPSLFPNAIGCRCRDDVPTSARKRLATVEAAAKV